MIKTYFVCVVLLVCATVIGDAIDRHSTQETLRQCIKVHTPAECGLGGK